MKPPTFAPSTVPVAVQPSQLQLWIAASMLRLESRDTAPIPPAQWQEDY